MALTSHNDFHLMRISHKRWFENWLQSPRRCYLNNNFVFSQITRPIPCTAWLPVYFNAKNARPWTDFSYSLTLIKRKECKKVNQLHFDNKYLFIEHKNDYLLVNRLSSWYPHSCWYSAFILYFKHWNLDTLMKKTWSALVNLRP